MWTYIMHVFIDFLSLLKGPTFATALLYIQSAAMKTSVFGSFSAPVMSKSAVFNCKCWRTAAKCTRSNVSSFVSVVTTLAPALGFRV